MSGDDSSIVLFESFVYFLRSFRSKKKTRDKIWKWILLYNYFCKLSDKLFVKNDKCGMENGTK